MEYPTNDNGEADHESAIEHMGLSLTSSHG
jgi:hypothetical protein